MIKHNRYIIFGYWSFVLLSLVIACIISTFLNMWTLVYPILLVAPCIWTIFVVRIWFANFLQKQVLVNWSSTKTIVVSILIHMLLTIGLMLPLLTGVLINSIIGDTFNIYMLLIFFVLSMAMLLGFMYLDNKRNAKINVKKPVCVKE